MKRPARPATTALALAAAVLLVGCGSAAPAIPGPATQDLPGGAPFLTTSFVTTGGAWAIAVMGGSASSLNNFWQLFVRPAGSTKWKLATPPGVASNGGLVAADAAGQSLITGFRPSERLHYTPLTVTRDGGDNWSPAGPLVGALANVPDALAAAPGTGRLLALLTNGTAKQSAPGYTRWSTLTSERALAATPAGQRCGLARLTAATFTAAGLPLLAGTCIHPGTVGIFADGGGTWLAAGPRLAPALAHQPVTVLRLTQIANRTVALLEAGSGRAARLFAAWSSDGGSHWVLAPPLQTAGARISAASFGATGVAAIVLGGSRAEIIAGAGSGWRSLPALPAGTATLAAGPAGGFDALAVHRTKLTVWLLAAGSTTWRTTQTMIVPIQFGSSS
jgi:hypothetical protein